MRIRLQTLNFTFDEEQQMDSLTINAHYSTAEILKKAGLNTILGMGTVFVVLIFISFIISLFRFIPELEKKFKNKKPAEPAKHRLRLLYQLQNRQQKKLQMMQSL